MGDLYHAASVAGDHQEEAIAALLAAAVTAGRYLELLAADPAAKALIGTEKSRMAAVPGLVDNPFLKPGRPGGRSEESNRLRILIENFAEGVTRPNSAYRRFVPSKVREELASTKNPSKWVAAFRPWLLRATRLSLNDPENWLGSMAARRQADLLPHDGKPRSLESAFDQILTNHFERALPRVAKRKGK